MHPHPSLNPLIAIDVLGLSSTGELTADINRMELPDGEEKYAMALADFVGDPSLSAPLTVGLYSRWGAGKSVILNRIQGIQGFFIVYFGRVKMSRIGKLADASSDIILDVILMQETIKC